MAENINFICKEKILEIINSLEMIKSNDIKLNMAFQIPVNKLIEIGCLAKQLDYLVGIELNRSKE
jgi:hypothetical protein